MKRMCGQAVPVLISPCSFRSKNQTLLQLEQEVAVSVAPPTPEVAVPTTEGVALVAAVAPAPSITKEPVVAVKL